MRDEILSFARICKLFSSKQAARKWFHHRAQPQKKASEFLHEMVKDRFLETKKRRAIDEYHVYRLTKKGRISSGGDFHPVPFIEAKITHWLGLTNLYLDMCDIETPMIYTTEIRDEYTFRGMNYHFSPDVFAVWLERALFIEYQRSPLSSARWRKKWSVYEHYFSSGAFKYGPWQLSPIVKPRVICVSNQRPETVGVNSFKIELVQDIKELQDIFKWEGSH